MVQNIADGEALILMHFPDLNLRMPEAGASGHSSERLSVGRLAPEVTSGCPGHVCVVTTAGVPRGARRSPGSVLEFLVLRSVCSVSEMNRDMWHLKKCGGLESLGRPGWQRGLSSKVKAGTLRKQLPSCLLSWETT